MGCGTDEVCGDATCGANSECDGFHATCGGNATTVWTDAPTIPVGTLIKDEHITELQTAINDERTNVDRTSRDSGGPPWACSSNTPGLYPFTAGVVSGAVVEALHLNEVADAINTTPFNVDGNTEGPGSPASNVSVGAIIDADDVNDLRSFINTAETNCICVSYCSCDIDCDCDGDLTCVCDVDSPY
jgi:hypothetical protein